MKDDASTLSVPELPRTMGAGGPYGEQLGLVLVWSASQALRCGEIILLPADGIPRTLGRGGGKEPSRDGDSPPRLQLFRQRPASLIQVPPLAELGLSRKQLVITANQSTAEVLCTGKCPLLVNGQRVERTITIKEGDTLHLLNQALFLCVRRSATMPPLRDFPDRSVGDFGLPDLYGLAGESPKVWWLRDQLAFLAKADAHILILGASGTGKELAAQAIHALSGRSRRHLVARNAATFPAELIDAELFGNVRDYPNPGMRERAGLIGESDGGTLFLDEIGELPTNLQTHLLRVFDQNGEYQRLGESLPRRAKLHLIAATNRAPEHLKSDLRSRFTLRLTVPTLNERREDIPLLADFLLRRAQQQSPQLVRRCLSTDSGEREMVRMNPALLDALLRHSYSLHMRELHSLLWVALQSSTESYLDLTPEVRARLGSDAAEPAASRPEPLRDAGKQPQPHATGEPGAGSSGRPELTKEAILDVLQRHGGNLSQAYAELGLTSRYALYRVLKRHGLPLR